jgi:Transposase, Mutator family
MTAGAAGHAASRVRDTATGIPDRRLGMVEKDKAAILVVLAALRDGRKVIVAVESGYRESTESWAAILRDLKRRGLVAPRLVIGDGHPGIWGRTKIPYAEIREAAEQQKRALCQRSACCEPGEKKAAA